VSGNARTPPQYRNRRVLPRVRGGDHAYVLGDVMTQQIPIAQSPPPDVPPNWLPQALTDAHMADKRRNVPVPHAVGWRVLVVLKGGRDA